MLEQLKLNQVMNNYVEQNLSLNFNKIDILEKFRETEQHLKEYTESLTELEKQQNRINLKEFQGLANKTIEILMDFNSENMTENIENVNGINNFFIEVERDLVDTSESLVHARKIWNSFLYRNQELSDSLISIHVLDRLEKAKKHMESITPNEIGVIFTEIESIRQEIERITLIIEKLKNEIILNVFIGEENDKLLETIKNFLMNVGDISIHEYINQANAFLEEISEIKKSSKYGKAKVPLVKVINKHKPSIYRYTLLFGDNLVKYDPFFNSMNGLEAKSTSEYIYLENYPIHGIFSGKEIVENLAYDENYFNLVNEITNKSVLSFNLLVSILIISGVLFSFLGLFAITFYVLIVIISVLGFSYFLSFVKNKLENKFSIKNAFMYINTNFYIAEIGEDLDLKTILLGVIQDFDNTILNKKFQNSNNIDYV